MPAKVSIKKIIAASKFLGASHRAKKKISMQSHHAPGSFRNLSHEDDEGSESLDNHPLLKSHSGDSHPKSKRKVNFLEHASLSRSRSPRRHDTHHKHRDAPRTGDPEKGDRKLPSPHSAFAWFPRPHVPNDNASGRPQEKGSPGGDVEELCQEYERMEKTQYAEMLKKAKFLRRENIPFLHRKHSPSSN